MVVSILIQHLYTGNYPYSQTLLQLDFGPDFVWIKVINSDGHEHGLIVLEELLNHYVQ
jgi:hypothetical protein